MSSLHTAVRLSLFVHGHLTLGALAEKHLFDKDLTRSTSLNFVWPVGLGASTAVLWWRSGFAACPSSRAR